MTDLDPGSAPLVELKVAAALRIYERIKLALMITTLMVVTVSGAYLIGLANNNKESLTILRCAVSKEVRNKPNGDNTTDAEARTAFDRCVRRGGPSKNEP